MAKSPFREIKPVHNPEDFFGGIHIGKMDIGKAKLLSFSERELNDEEFEFLIQIANIQHGSTYVPLDDIVKHEKSPALFSMLHNKITIDLDAETVLSGIKPHGINIEEMTGPLTNMFLRKMIEKMAFEDIEGLWTSKASNNKSKVSITFFFVSTEDKKKMKDLLAAACI